MDLILQIIAFCVGIIAAVSLLWAVLIEPNAIALKEEQVFHPKLSDGLDGLKIVFLSDLHIGRKRDLQLIEKHIPKINSVKPDLVLVGGDIARDVLNLKNAAIALGSIKSEMGVHVARGNHDADLGQSFFSVLEQAGLNVYKNGQTILKRNVDGQSNLKRKGNGQTILKRNGDVQTNLKCNVDVQSNLKRNADEQSILKRDGDEQSALKRNGNGQSILKRNGNGQTILKHKCDEQSILKLNGNEQSILKRNGGEFTLAVLDDYLLADCLPSIALRGIKPAKDRQRFSIVLAHEPKSIELIAKEGLQDRVDLAFVGHTHGGQITAFGIYSPMAGRFAPRWTSQWRDIGGIKTLYSNGCGQQYRIRFFAPPQINIVTLRKGV